MLQFKFVLIHLFLILLLSESTLLQAETAAGDSSHADLSEVGFIAEALHVETPPDLDGEVLHDEVWQKATPVTGFYQTTPDEGEPATEKTEVRVVYTAHTLFLGVVCYDDQPDRIIVSDSRRDASLNDTDSFQVILDTYHDKQNGFVFGTNPAGIEYDAQVTNEGRGSFGRGRQRGGSGGGFNLNWDGSWEVRTRISRIGWSAEFAIPFRTLRFGKGKNQVWGINFQRNIRRRKETAYWARLPRQYNLNRVSLAGTLTGLQILSQKNLKVMPYALGEGARDFSEQQDTAWDGDAGFDIKYSLTPSLTLDATYNTDFAQVEVDEQQINLNRFNLFFPEKRPFFLENAGFFSVGSPGEVEMFFSRQIGISETGGTVPIVAGARVSGKLSGLNVGLLNMQTESMAADSIPANNFTVVRINKELPNRSAIGALLVNRQATGDLAQEDDYNRTFAVDGRLGIGKFGQISGYGARTVTPGLDGDEYAFQVSSSYNSQAWLLLATYTEVADNFNPEVGFLRRRGFRRPEFLIFHRYRPNHFLGLHELRPHVSYRGFWNFRGFQETGFLHIDNHWEWKNGYEIHTGINFTREGVTEPFEIFPGIAVPAGTYDHVEAQIVAFTNRGAWWSFRVFANIGGFFGGDRVALSPALRLRLRERFNTELSLSRNDIDLPVGSFVTNLFRARISYSFSPRLFVQGLLQYNDRDDVWSTNLRFGWLQTANTGLFVVFNETRDTFDNAFDIQNRSFIIKYSRLFDLLN
ncbi:MAG: DUF5916 domain-containing protein [bacterium]